MKIARHLLLFFFVLYCMLYVFPRRVGGQEQFTVNYDTTYLVELDGSAEVNQTITLSNNYSETYASSYDLILEGPIPTQIQAFENEETIVHSVNKSDNRTIISVTFPSAVVGKGKGRTFSIKYKLTNVAIKNGQVWEVTIPKVITPDSINSKVLTLYVPKNLGLPAYISPEPKKRDSTDNHHIFSFDKEDLLKAGVVAAFGRFQVFSFDLTYHIENQPGGNAEQTIALLPDTSFQRVFYTDIKPVPKDIHLDEDGNWIGVYDLRGKEKLDVKVSGSAQIFAEPQTRHPNITPVGDLQLREAKYWEVKDPEIRSLAKDFRDPNDIYQFVVTLLDYDYSRISQEAVRLGAKGALESPLRSVCREFTDLFIAISRAGGIPAREVNGFAYTENPEIQPLSLVADILHAWPEYWDAKKRLWVPVDPTWGKTTGGIDFFSKFDLSHVTFAIHGKDPEFPLPAGAYKIEDNPQKDVSIGFGPLPNLRSPDIKLKLEKKSFYVPFLPTTYLLTLENAGTAASYNLPISQSSQGAQIITGIEDNAQKISFIAPFSKKEYIIRAKSPILEWGQEKAIGVNVSGIENGEIKEINTSISQVEVVLAEVVLIFLLIIVVIIFFYLLGKIAKFGTIQKK